MEDQRKRPAVSMGVLAHVDAGKTTLSEALLYVSGAIRSMGRVDHKDAYLDTDEMERQRGITIFSKMARFSYEDTAVILLDTPGHVDFTAEMERTLSVLDHAILVISGTDGVQGHTRTLWRLLEHYKVPCTLFVNKMDISHNSQEELISQLQEKLSENCVAVGGLYDEEGISLGQAEQIALCDEDLLDHFLDTGCLNRECLREKVAERKVFPVLFGSALKLLGVEELLRLVRDLTVVPAAEESFAARCFKIGRDEKGNRLTYLKILGGTLSVKDVVCPGEKIDEIRLYSGEKYERVQQAGVGEICGVLGMDSSYAGMTLGSCDTQEVPLTEPVLSYQVIPPEGCLSHVLLGYMRQLEEEDPTLRVIWQEKEQQVHVHLMGPVQTEILQQQLKKRYGILVTFGAGAIRYKETIRGAVEGVGHFEPLRHYAEAHVLIEALPQGSGIEYRMDCPQDVLDLNWQRLICTHLQERQHRGVLTGAPLTDVRFTVVTGKAHKKHTEGGDFRQATYRAVRQGLRKAESVLLEPYYRVRIEVPGESLGKVMTDLDRMQGQFASPEMEGDMSILQGIAPVSKMRDYGVKLAEITGGMGQMNLSLEGYFPCKEQDEVMEQLGYDPDRDEENTCDSVFCGHGAGYIVPWYEVEEKMHMPMASYLYEKNMEQREEDIIAAAKEKARQMKERAEERPYDGYGGLESDLEEIFVREFGEIKRRLPAAEKQTVDAARRERIDEARESYRRTHGEKKQPKKKKRYLLVDGYNVIFAWKELEEIARDNLDGARGRLLDILCNYQGHIGDEVIVVFDAYRVSGHREEVGAYQNIYVVYTKEAETADAYIERTTHEMAGQCQVTVATSDRREQMIVLGEGAGRMSARDLQQEVERINREAMEEYHRQRSDIF